MFIRSSQQFNYLFDILFRARHQKTRSERSMSKILFYGLNRFQVMNTTAIHFRSKLKTYHNHLRNIAANNSLASLSSVQLGDSAAAFVIINKTLLRKGVWNNYTKAKQLSYDSYLNPKIIDFSQKEAEEWEECCTYPGMKFLIARSQKINLKYQNEEFTEKVEQFSGFLARIIQQQVSLLDGLDLVKISKQIAVIDPAINGKCGQTINNLHVKYQQERLMTEKDKTSASNSCSAHFKPNPQIFNELRRELVYSVIDVYKK